MDTAALPSSPATGDRRSLAVWQLTDGKPGHENQARGLIDALKQYRDVTCCPIAVPPHRQQVRDALTGQFGPGATLPDPDLIVAVGHATHLPALAARRARGGRVIVLMKPTLPMTWFDLCFVPEHDLVHAPAGVVTTRGVLNPIVPPRTRPTGHGLILIGGPSRHHDWSPDELIAQIRRLVTLLPQQRWVATTSRRTPQDFTSRLRLSPLSHLEVVPVEDTTPDWLRTRMAESEVVFVTEDSVSMIYEALTSGADVGLLRVPVRRTGRVTRGVDQLIQDRLVIRFENWERERFERRRPLRLQEAQRCARLVHDLFLDAA